MAACVRLPGQVLYTFEMFIAIYLLTYTQKHIMDRVKFFDSQPSKDHCLRPKFCPISVINIVDYYLSYIILTICKLDF